MQMGETVPLKFYGRSKKNAVVPLDTRRPDWLRVRLPGGPNSVSYTHLTLPTICSV